MEYKEFLETIAGEICRRNRDLSVKIKKVEKNNGIIHDGLVMNEGGKNAGPVIYLNEYYEDYRKDHDIDRQINRIWNAYEGAVLDTASFFQATEWGFVKDKIRPGLVNYKMNENLLKGLPHEIFLDLAVTYYVDLDESQERNASVRITNALLKEWGISEDTLKKTAYGNQREFNFPVIRSMEDVIRNMFRNAFLERGQEESGREELETVLDDMVDNMKSGNKCDMYVLTNKSKYRGASGILCVEVLKKFAESIKNDFYILPSSIHETILIPYDEKCSPDALRAMVREVNEQEVALEEILSDSVYYFDKEEEKVNFA